MHRPDAWYVKKSTENVVKVHEKKQKSNPKKCKMVLSSGAVVPKKKCLKTKAEALKVLAKLKK
jgi:hypothetical protein